MSLRLRSYYYAVLGAIGALIGWRVSETLGFIRGQTVYVSDVLLGAIGISADGQGFQCSACAFLRAGSACPVADGSKSLVLPTNRNNILDPNNTGGAAGFIGFPAVIFRRGFSLYSTGRAGYAPARTYFETVVDTLAPHLNVATTAEMNDRELRELPSQFDAVLSNANPIAPLAAVERDAQLTSSPVVSVTAREKATFHFSTTPGAALSSITWRLSPLSNIGNRQILETNLCLTMNGEESCFTGVEDFAHCAFFVPCQTGYASLVPIAGDAYIATRYFPVSSAPLIGDGRITATSQAPDIGAVLEMQVKVRVRDVEAIK